MRVRRMSALLAGLVALVMVVGCAPRYAYHQDVNGSGRVKGYYLSDGSYVKVHPVHGSYKVQKVVKKRAKKR